MYALKRYTFRGQPFSSTIFEGICPDLNIKWSSIADDNKTDDPYFQSIKNKLLFDQGRFNLTRWLALGYLSCTHADSEEQKENFWHLVNPALDEHVHISKVVDVLVSFIEVAIDMRIEIESRCGAD